MSSKLSDGKSIGGKGRLTDRMIDLITTYYGNAIRQNKTCMPDMRKAVWAVYFHIRSSDEEPLHSFCPVGPNSWCKYQNQVLEGSVENFRHSNKLPVAVMDAIKPVFNDLSQPKLLQKCLGGKTQNNNESINSLIWKLCPKTLGCGRKIVDISTNEAIVVFNDGNQGRLKIMQSLGLTVGQFAHKFVTLVDIRRIQTAEVHFNLCTKEVRQAKRMQFKTTLNLAHPVNRTRICGVEARYTTFRPIGTVVKVSDYVRHIMSSSQVPLKTRRVRQRSTLNLSRAETSSRLWGAVVRRRGASSGVVHVKITSTSGVVHGSKLRGPSPKALV
ncbi:uncharacterized protein TNCV_4466101 [Trichonephila clavipes]|nr:uncharacterized protein TNCV_4466101 [Trichonephila clavipes]